jgi:hypothetical protein
MHHAFKLHARASAGNASKQQSACIFMARHNTLFVINLDGPLLYLSLSLAGSFAHPHTPQRRAISQGPEAQINYYLAAAISLVTMRVTANFTIVEQHKAFRSTFCVAEIKSK